MSASTEPAAAEPAAIPRILAGAWRPAGAIWLLFSLTGLVIGLRPGCVWVYAPPAGAAPLPALQTVAVAQVGYLMLVHPLVWTRRLRAGERLGLPECLPEVAGLLLATVPIYVVAGWLSDATAGDVARVAIKLVSIWPAAWAGGAYLAAGPGRSAALLSVLVAALGLPAAWYVASEFFPSAPVGLWQAAPVLSAWTAAESRVEGVLPGPLWALLLWPALALAAGAARPLLRIASDRRPQIP